MELDFWQNWCFEIKQYELSEISELTEIGL
jgi:hypothetical protein